MDNPNSTSPASPSSQGNPFQNWAECLKALKHLPQSITEQDREALLTRINGSPELQSIAFELLWSLHASKEKPWAFLEKPMLNVLGHGSDEPRLQSKTVPSEGASWVFTELRDVHTVADWKQFAASGRHLWVILAILKAASNKPVMVESLVALAECVEHCQNTTELGRQKKVGILAADSQWIARLIKSRTPAGSELSKPFLEALYALNATAELGAELRQASNALQNRLQSTGEALATERQARQNAESSVQSLETSLAEVRGVLETVQSELAAERLHSSRQGGFNTVAKQETVNQVLATVRQGTLHRLENIRAYADREKPNREEILELVGEIEAHLAKVERILEP